MVLMEASELMLDAASDEALAHEAPRVALTLGSGEKVRCTGAGAERASLTERERRARSRPPADARTRHTAPGRAALP